MSDLEYDSADSSQDAAMEQSALETAKAAGERGSAKDPTVESLNEGQSPVSPESTGEDEEEEEDSGAEASEAGEEQTEAVAGAGGEQEDGESSGEDATAADTLTESAREAASKSERCVPLYKPGKPASSKLCAVHTMETILCACVYLYNVT